MQDGQNAVQRHGEFHSPEQEDGQRAVCHPEIRTGAAELSEAVGAKSEQIGELGVHKSCPGFITSGSPLHYS